MLQGISSAVAARIVLNTVIRDIKTEAEKSNIPPSGLKLIERTYDGIGDALFELYSSGHLEQQDNDTGICILTNGRNLVISVFHLKKILEGDGFKGTPEEIEAAKSKDFWGAIDTILSDNDIDSGLASYIVTLRMGEELLKKWLDSNYAEAEHDHKPVVIVTCGSDIVMSDGSDVLDSLVARMKRRAEGAEGADEPKTEGTNEPEMQIETCGVFVVTSIPRKRPVLQAVDRATGELVPAEEIVGQEPPHTVH